MSSTQRFIGEQHEVPYPFTRDAGWEEFDDGMYSAVTNWRPGCGVEDDPDNWAPDDPAQRHYADGMGTMILQVIARYKPGKYPERTFYVRQWRDPDGHTFGKTNLRVTTSATFYRMRKGYRHEFSLKDEP